MKYLLFFTFALLTSLGSTATYLRLSTTGTRTLNVGDSLISTLGLFKATLQTNGCTIAVYRFNTVSNVYLLMGNYSSTMYSGNCNYLTIQNSMLLDNSGRPYLTTPITSYNYSTIFNIDDEGVMRLISSYMLPNMVDIVSSQTSINQFQTRSPYFKALSRYSVAFTDIFKEIINLRKWRFNAQYGQLTISNIDNPAISIIYVYSTFTIRDTKIYDFRNVSFPGVLFTNISFEPQSNQPQSYLDFNPPYVLVASQYWPAVTVYEQGGYKILDIWLSNLPQFEASQNIAQIGYYHFYSPCPRRTFQYRGDCVSTCPTPYYHQMSGQSGFCVLSCQQYSTINQTQRICSFFGQYEQFKLNPTNYIQSCPNNSYPTPYGCACTSVGYYYDGILTFGCVLVCPNSTIAISMNSSINGGVSGVCMRCPDNCIQCIRDAYNRQFLECQSCNSGYTVANGQCVISCPLNNGYSLISGSCIKCQDINCVDCSVSQSVCNKCNLMYSLRSGTCVTQCSNNQLSVYASGFSISCLPRTDPNCQNYITSFYQNIPFIKCDQCISGYVAYLDKCVLQCPSNYSPLNGYCICNGNLLTINDQCLNMPGCPIMMSFDSQSYSCISCPFGCMSCANPRQCTSCNPGYFLYISPQNIICRRKTPLFPCNGQYSWQRFTCAITNYQDPNLSMTLCYSTVSNCQICIPYQQLCVFCLTGFYIYNNTCIASCPIGLIPYQNTCILPEITNCLVPHLLSLHQQAVVTTYSLVSQSYKYFTYGGQEMANDPIGYIPYFQELTTQTIDGIPRQTDFFQPSWICLKCSDKYGLSNDFKSCLPCPASCPSQLCYMARPDSCVLPYNPICPPGQFVDSQSGACVLTCNGSNQYFYVSNGTQYCGIKTIQRSNVINATVDSSIFQMRNGSKLYFFVFSDKLNVDNSVYVMAQGINQSPQTAQTPGMSKLGDSGQIQNPIPISIQNGQYIQINNQDYNAMVLNFSQVVSSLANAPVSLENPIYGSVKGLDHTVFMSTWLAYIGEIMSLTVIVLHMVFIGNKLLYKVDNLLIFIQTIFYFSFVDKLEGKLLSQFYYGWSFAHARFLPNLFWRIIPDGYTETAYVPTSYMLFNVDGNYFRNAGFSLVWLLIYISCWIVVTLFIWIIVSYYLRKKEAWHPEIALQALIAGFQFFSMNLVFFSVSQLAYSSPPQQSSFQQYYQTSQGFAITTLVVITIYTFARFLYKRVGGLYMLKRSIFAIILVFSFDRRILIIPFVLMEVIFAGSRHIIQRPIQRKQQIFIWVQCFVLFGCYFLLYFCMDAGVNTVIISIIIFIFIVYLAYDLTTLYLQSRNQFPQDDLIQQYEEIGKDYRRTQTLSYLAGFKPSVSSQHIHSSQT